MDSTTTANRNKMYNSTTTTEADPKKEKVTPLITTNRELKPQQAPTTTHPGADHNQEKKAKTQHNHPKE